MATETIQPEDGNPEANVADGDAPLAEPAVAVAPEEPKIVRQIETRVRVLVGVQQGRRTLQEIWLPVQDALGMLVPHTVSDYAALYPAIEQAMDQLQAEIDAAP